MLRKIEPCSCKKAARKSAKTFGKDSDGESEGLHCLYRQKDNRICEIAFFENACLAVHSNALPYITDVPVSSSL